VQEASQVRVCGYWLGGVCISSFSFKEVRRRAITSWRS
jgi:hypothetical protein